MKIRFVAFTVLIAIALFPLRREAEASRSNRVVLPIALASALGAGMLGYMLGDGRIFSSRGSGSRQPASSAAPPRTRSDENTQPPATARGPEDAPGREGSADRGAATRPSRNSTDSQRRVLEARRFAETGQQRLPEAQNCQSENLRALIAQCREVTERTRNLPRVRNGVGAEAEQRINEFQTRIRTEMEAAERAQAERPLCSQEYQELLACTTEISRNFEQARPRQNTPAPARPNSDGRPEPRTDS